jgi:hypothetical protein
LLVTGGYRDGLLAGVYSFSTSCFVAK